MRQFFSYFGLLLTAMFMVTAFAFGQDVPPGGVLVPDADPLYLLTEIVTNWKVLGLIGSGPAIVVMLVQILKKYAPEFKLKLTAVTVLSVLYSVLIYYGAGASWLSALVQAFISGGGAIAIYQAYKQSTKVLDPSLMKKR